MEAEKVFVHLGPGVVHLVCMRGERGIMWLGSHGREQQEW